MPSSGTISGMSVGEFTVRFEIDTDGTGAITATRGDNVVAAKTGTGTYTVTPTAGVLRNTGAALLPFAEVLHRQVQLLQATPTAFWATITGVVASTGVISITTLQANASPAATNVSAVSTIAGYVTFRL